MFVVVLWHVFGVPRSSHVLLALVIFTEREWVGLFRECSIFEREEWYPEFGLAYDELCWSQEWLSLVLAVFFLCSFLLSCACSAVVRACGRFARHVALWASTVSTFSTPCAFLSVYRLHLCELLFFAYFVRTPFAPRPLSVMWRRHGRFSGALFGLQALSTSRPRYYKLLLQIDDRSNPELCLRGRTCCVNWCIGWAHPKSLREEWPA